MEKILVFGTGQFYQHRKLRLLEKAEIVGFLDNDKQRQGTVIDEKLVYAPDKAMQLSWDYIVLMSAKTDEMYSQLRGLGIPKEKILRFRELFHGELQIHTLRQKDFRKKNRQKALIVTDVLNYNGGSLAALYAAEALGIRGYQAVLTAADADVSFLEEAVGQGHTVYICPALPYLGVEELTWMSQFDIFIVNTFQMLRTAVELAAIGPVLWWIHEPSDMYIPVLKDYANQNDIKKLQEPSVSINIAAVAPKPKINFNRYFPDRIKQILPYGIPDHKQEKAADCEQPGKIVFAVIGTVIPKKAQDIFIKAVLSLEESYRDKASFWLVGWIGEDVYSKLIKEMAENHDEIKICGNYDRKQMEEAYGRIQVVVCPSLEDSLPIVMTEGMMYGKVCIASDQTGTMEYIQDEWNGLICKAGSVESLAEKLRWVIDHRDHLTEMGKRARKIYEETFTMDHFSKRLNDVVKETTQQWEAWK